MVLTAYSTLSPAIGLCCHRPRCDAEHRHQVDASVEASGPHGLAVHDKRIRLLRRRVHRIPRPTFSDDRETPLIQGHGTRGLIEMICPTSRTKYFCRREWTVESALFGFAKFDFWRNGPFGAVQILVPPFRAGAERRGSTRRREGRIDCRQIAERAQPRNMIVRSA